MIGIIGYGNIGRSLVKGLLRKDNSLSPEIFVADNRTEFLNNIKNNKDFIGCANNTEVVQKCKVVFLCVKPNIFHAIATDIKDCISEDTLLVSVAPNFKIAELKAMFNHKNVIRLMPNTSMEVCEGVMISSKSPTYNNDSILSLYTSIIERVGKVFWVPENKINATIGVAGSGSAFVYMLLESMGQGGILNGLTSSEAYDYAAQTIIGAGKMYLESNIHPSILRDQVCSPGGITIRAIDVLEENGFRNAIIKAVKETNI